jgi:major membrane immunogen (membrane-anchored lipoprotein)
MKKILFVLAAGMLLTSCGNSDVEAATDFCACYSSNADNTEAAAESQSMTEMLEAVETANAETTKCITDWQTKFQGKITKEGFGAELKKQCPDAYDEAVTQGVL